MDLNQKKLNLNLSTKKFNISEDKDEVTIEGYASRMFVDGKPTTDLDGEHIKTTDFKLEAKRLLLNHDIEDSVGEIELSHRPDGIYLKGIVYKDTMKSQDWARLKKGLFDFSVGFIAEEAEYRNIEGKEVLVFTKGIVYEVSLVSIPSNKYATLDVMKSVRVDDTCNGLECSIEHLKSMNPNMDCSCLDGLKEEAQTKSLKRENMDLTPIKEKIIKGLTINDTMNERWNISDDLFQMFSYFVSTIEDNIYEFKWEDNFTREQMIANINEAMEVFKQTIQEESLRIGNAIGKDELQGEGTMVTKSVETSEATPIVETQSVQTEQANENVVTEVVATEVESKEEVKVEETKVEPTVEVSKEEIIETESKEEVVSDEPKVETENNELANTLDFKQETINILKADLGTLQPEAIKELYDTLASKLEQAGALDAYTALQKIEQYVEQELQN